jgi:homospermidine synthase
MVIIDPDDSARAIAGIADIRFEQVALLPDTLRSILAPLLSAGGFLVNLSVGVSSRRHRCHRSMAVPQRDRAVGKSLHLA